MKGQLENHHPKRIVIAAGGTAGHVVPALAVADALRDLGAQVSFIGGARAEAQLVPEAGYELAELAVEGLSRTDPRRAVRALVRAGTACLRARRLLRTASADAVLGAGGYLAGVVGLAAVSQRIPLVLTEADSRLGLANRLLAPMATSVCLAFPVRGRTAARYVLTGRPIPAVGGDRLRGRARLGIGVEEPAVLIFGGSLGARSINQAAFAAFARPGRRDCRDGPVGVTATCGDDGLGGTLHVVHVSGSRDYQDLAGRERRQGYDLHEYLDTAAFGDAVAAADLVIARAGGSIFEIAAHGRPAILIPYPNATGDHQRANARWMRDGGAAVVIEDEQLTAATLVGTVHQLLGDPGRLAEMSAAARALARPDAAVAVARRLLEAAGG